MTATTTTFLRTAKGWTFALARGCAMQIPAIRRLRDDRSRLLEERQKLSEMLASSDRPFSPFFHYNAVFDPLAIMRRHAVSNLNPNPDYLTNFLGVLIDPKFFPSILEGRAGAVEPIPIPANWHSDIAEWGAALRAVELAERTFTMVELGCGWGCWMNNTGVAARRAGLEVRLIGVEGDEHHIEFSREATATNGFDESRITLIHGIAAPRRGIALFPKHDRPGEHWGLEPIFDADDGAQQKALKSGNYEALPMISLADVVSTAARVDLLHVDIQGGEADLISGCIACISESVAYLLIGTHSRQIEGRLFDTLLQAGWKLEMERPAILDLGVNPTVTVDGVQGWRNPKLLPL